MMRQITFLVFLVMLICSGLALIPRNNGDDETIEFLGKTFYKHEHKRNSAIDPKIFRQCMDHFNASGCNQKWDQRYWVREDFFKPGGPIFFMFGGEGAADFFIENFAWLNYAEHYGALLIAFEHRFYGESFPTDEQTIEAFQLHTSQQALADAAYFIDSYKEERSLTNNSWVALGCSYPGNLAAWFKQKYPTHVKTAVVSSGPLLAEYDFPGYLNTISNIVQATEPQCYETIRSAFQCMESLVNGTGCQGYNSTADIIPALRGCESVDFEDRLTRERFFIDLVMTKWTGNSPTEKIGTRCPVLEATQGPDELDRYGKFLVEIGESGRCKIRRKDGEGGITSLLRKYGKKSSLEMWFWQTCYEFGYYQSSDPVHGLFGSALFSGDAYGTGCEEEYGTRFATEYVKERVRLTNEYYKGKDIDTKCTIFVNGEWDPWHSNGINDPSETSVNNTVIFIPRAEHCSDYYVPPQSEQTREAQEKIQEQIGIYLNDPNC